jgi:5-methylcytosine-specific restriction endonuclease McrA
MNLPLARLSNPALLDQVKRLVQRERQATATLVAHLAEVKRRKLYLAEGYGSMFRYCTQALHLSEHATYLRLEAARMALRFPAILTALEKGELNLTSIRLLAPHLTAENLDELIPAARHRTRTEVEALLAARYPRPDLPTVIRKLPEKQVRRLAVEALSLELPRAPGTNLPCASPGAGADVAGTSMSAGFARRVPSPAGSRPVIAPIAPERYKMQFTASAATHAKLRRVQDLLRRRIPNGDVAEIFDLALSVLVAKLEKQKHAATDRPRPARMALDRSPLRDSTTSNSRTIPAEVKRAVWSRDGGQCAFIGTSHRCTETGFLEFHHVVPFARGGLATSANIQLRCRAHNQYEAIRDFGRRDAHAVWEYPNNSV